MRLDAAGVRFAGLAVLALVLAGGCATRAPGWQDGADCDFADTDFSGSFPGGALAGCRQTGPHAFTLAIEPEAVPINPSPWYAFDIASETPQRLTLTLDYGDYRHRYAPKVARGSEWMPLDTDVLTSEGGTRARFHIEVPAGVTRVAAQEILTLADESAWARKVAAATRLELDVLGDSAEGRPIPVLTGGEAEVGTLVIIGRQHPPEVTGAYALHAFVERLLADEPLAARFRERFALVIVPMLNPDGVARGHWRLDTAGIDLNRDWGPFERPETRLVRHLLGELFASGAAPVLVLDFHSTTRDVLYTQPDDADGERAWFPRAWHEAINARLEGPSVARNAAHNPGKPTLKSWVQHAHGIPGITFEIGDATPRPRIEALGRIAAEEAMCLLLAGRSGAPAG